MRITLTLKEGLEPNASAEAIRQLIETNTGHRCNVRMASMGTSVSGSSNLRGVRHMIEGVNARNVM